MDSIINLASVVKSDKFSNTTLGREIAKDFVASDFPTSFAEPKEINEMTAYFGIDDKSVADSKVADKLKFIFDFSKQSDLGLSQFLSEAGMRVGGRMNPNVLNNMYVYLKTLSNEMSIRNEYNRISSERKMMESGYENSNNL